MVEAPRKERKVQGIERTLTQTGNSHIEQKSVPLIDFTYACIIIGGNCERKLKSNLSMVDCNLVEH